jgi:hypothetical protein
VLRAALPAAEHRLAAGHTRLPSTRAERTRVRRSALNRFILTIMRERSRNATSDVEFLPPML